MPITHKIAAAGGGNAGVHRRGIAAFGGGESRRLAAETPYPRRRAKGDRTPSMVSAVAHYPLFRAVRGLNEY